MATENQSAGGKPSDRVTCADGHGDVHNGFCYNCETAVPPTAPDASGERELSADEIVAVSMEDEFIAGLVGDSSVEEFKAAVEDVLAESTPAPPEAPKLLTDEQMLADRYSTDQGDVTEWLAERRPLLAAQAALTAGEWQAKVDAAEAERDEALWMTNQTIEIAKGTQKERDAVQQQAAKLAEALGSFVKSMTIRPDGSRNCGACGAELTPEYIPLAPDEHDEECFVLPLETAFNDWQFGTASAALGQETGEGDVGAG